MPLIDDVIVRRATAEDHDAIVKNGDVNGVLDYLAAIFLQVVNDPDVYPVVAELKGQVVGVMMDHVIDGGISVIRRGVRTLPGYRNMGIMRKMDETLTSLTEVRIPELRYRYECVPTWDNQPPAVSRHLEGFVDILHKSIMMLIYTVPEITGLDAKDGLPAVLALEYDDVRTLFTLDDLLVQLFPLKRLFNFFIGYRCLESNIKHVLGEDKKVFITTKTPSHTQDTKTPSHTQDTKTPSHTQDTKTPSHTQDTKTPSHTQDTKTPSHTQDTKTHSHTPDTKTPSHTPDTKMLSVLQDVDMVTFSYWYMAEAGLVYAIDIYAKEGHNEASLQAHILRHLRVLKELNLCDRGVLIVSLYRNMGEETVRSQLRNFGIMNLFPNAIGGNALFEKEL